MYGDEDPTAALAGQLPYPQLVDALRGGADGFGMGPQRPLSKAEKLQGTLGSLESFFSRLSAIGNPHGLDQGAQLGVQHGQQMYQQAMAQREEEAKGHAMMQAAQHRAALEQQALQEQHAQHEQAMKFKMLETLDRIGPNLSAPPLGPDEMGPQQDGPPPGAIEQAIRSNDPNALLRFYHPGLGKQRELDATAAREMANTRERGKFDIEQTNIREQHADSRNAASNASHERAVANGNKNTGDRLTHAEAKADIDTLLKSDEGLRDPVSTLRIWAKRHSNGEGKDAVLDMDDDAANYFASRLGVAKQARSNALGPAARRMTQE